ncbi:hypothetical protein FHT40_001737 [Mycolicibacterium sp. BK556]|uniref:GNAT family N-acetyltransferase n=1 Tax=unclassified Mycolicibacterium TaxID=2636767 RepID=UPI00160D3A94|nr:MULTISPECIES: GNAT family N-acetyltransferase [unclassified Mycolicibacterium]MBB3602104.1 hypothetical protein [Mycolicibacterium sp. BK556]MBB3631856.1 hypothetical protein [Mycolicibacterium sp. BK607]MBB3749875.1 hypothetical protein [Mycolicibacterium sp. BK634]
MIEVREITSTSPEDLDLLHRFVEDAFKVSFPGDDERDVEAYFHRDQRGELGPNKTHVVVATDDGEVVGGCVSVYLGTPNVGVLEYQVVNPSHRSTGVATDIYLLSERLIEESAQRAGRSLDMFIAEIEDPFRTPMSSSMNRFRRAGILHYSGYSIADYPHVQRMLTVPGQEGMHTLLMLVKPIPWGSETSIPASTLRLIVDEYYKFFGIDEPASVAALDYLEAAGNRHIELRSLGDYVCNDEDTAPVVVEEIETGASGHRWSIRSRDAASAEGGVSFVATPASGFASALELAPALIERAVLLHICSRIEKQMIEDSRETHEWYLQCGGDLRDALVGADVGFHELAVPWDDSAHLLYKGHGRMHEAPSIPVANFLAAMREIPGADYAKLEQHLAGQETVPLA